MAKQAHQKPDLEPHKGLLAAGKAFWALVKHYRLTQEEAALCLGVSPSNRSRLKSLRETHEIPPESLRDVAQLLGIHKSLRIIYPENRELVYSWLKRPSDEFEGRSPLDYVKGQPEGFHSFALADLRARLDRERVSGPF